ncbi:MAG: sensor domain-containing diguanylate cyclase, partial [Acidimicrobiales bacterium]
NGDVVTVGDARKDERFYRLPLVTAEPGLVAYAGVPIRATSGENVGALGVFDLKPREFSEAERRALSELARLVEAELSALPHLTNDALTGTVNALTFNRIADRLLEFGDSRGEPSALLHIDLAGTSAINARHGFDQGDLAISHLASLIYDSVRASDLVGRIGGDKFGVLLPGADPSGAAVVVKRLAAAVEAYNEAAGSRFRLGFRHGVAGHEPGAGAEITNLLVGAAVTADLSLDH